MRAVGLILPTANTDKKIFLTGASGKIGIKLLDIFLNLGFTVIAHCSKNETVINNFLKKNPQHKNSVKVVIADFEKQIPEIPDDIYCLINCAAVFEKGNLKDPDNFLKTIQINDFIPAALSAKFAESVKEGNIINILDGNIYKFNKNYQNYRISKLFLEEITRQSAVLLAPNIRVNAVALGMLDKPDSPSYLFAKQKEILKNEITDRQIAQVIKLLMSCENITGQTIFLDNGVHLL